MKFNFSFSKAQSQQAIRRFLVSIKKIQHWWRMAQLVAIGHSRFITSAEYNSILRCAHDYGVSLEPRVAKLPGGSCESWQVDLPGEPAQKVAAGLGRRFLCTCHEWFVSSRVLLERHCRHTDAVQEFEKHLVGKNPRQLSLF